MPSSFLIASFVWLRAFSSSTWPKRISVTITAAASKYTATSPCNRKDSGKTPGKSVATTLYTYATLTPSPINVNMLRLRFCTERTART